MIFPVTKEGLSNTTIGPVVALYVVESAVNEQ